MTDDHDDPLRTATGYVSAVMATGAFVRLDGGLGSGFLPARRITGPLLGVGDDLEVTLDIELGGDRFALLPGFAPGAVPATPSAQESDPFKQLDAMIGLARVKRDMHALAESMEAQARKRQMGVTTRRGLPHLLFVGPPGTGKTTVARLVGEIYGSLGLVSSPRVTEVSGTKLVGQYVGETAKQVEKICTRARGGVLFVDEAYALAASGTRHYGQEAVNALLKFLEEESETTAVIFAGYESDIDDLLEMNAGLASRLPNRIVFEPYTVDELTAIFQGLADQDRMRLGLGVIEAVLGRFASIHRGPKFANGRVVRQFYSACLKAQEVRTNAEGATSAREARTLEVVDTARAAAFDSPHASPGDDDAAARAAHLRWLQGELDELVGLADVKATVRSLVDSSEHRRRQTLAGLPVEDEPHHLVLAGPPGTGKTTVARLLAEAFWATGVVDREAFHVKSPADLIGNESESTSKRTRKALDASIGGVLFIDEAYGILQSIGGQQVLTELLPYLIDHQANTVVMMAGYSDQMEQLLAANPGLRSRFGATLMFENYGLDDLVEILQRKALAADRILGPGALDAAREALDRLRTGKDFGNAREVERYYQRAQARQAARLRSGAGTVELATLTADDLREEAS